MIKNEVSLFLLEEEEIPPQPQNTTQTTNEPQNVAPTDNREQPPAEEVQEEPLTFSEIEKKAKIYKLFMRLNQIFQATKNFHQSKLYNIAKKRDKEEIEALIIAVEDRFEIANNTFIDYEESDQIKILKNTQSKIRKIQSLLKLPKSFK